MKTTKPNMRAPAKTPPTIPPMAPEERVALLAPGGWLSLSLVGEGLPAVGSVKMDPVVAVGTPADGVGGTIGTVVFWQSATAVLQQSNAVAFVFVWQNLHLSSNDPRPMRDRMGWRCYVSRQVWDRCFCLVLLSSLRPALYLSVHVLLYHPTSSPNPFCPRFQKEHDQPPP